MATKKLKKKVHRRDTASNITEPVKQSAREVWLAGLGALHIAQQEGGKILERGSKLFDKLVQEGNKFESKARDDIGGAVSDLRGEVEQRTESMRKQASDNWDKLEKIFEDRVARALAGLGIPTRDDINGLSARVGELADQVRKLDQGKASTGVASKSRSSSKKKTTKKAGKKTAKKAAKKTAKKTVKKTVVKKSGSDKS
jgi:poly(hydroxyalkanoate) granule-associated protein